MTGRWSRLDRHVRLVAAEGVHFGLMTGHWVAQQPNTEGLRLVVLSVSTVRSHSVTGHWQGPVSKIRFWNLTVNDRTLGVQRPINSGVVSGQGR